MFIFGNSRAINNWLPINKNLIKFLLFFTFSALFFLSFFLRGGSINISPASFEKIRIESFQKPSAASSFDIQSINAYKGLPVEDVKTYSVPNSWGTVVYIPQYHKNPGTNASDKKNDSAQKAQEEIYGIIGRLHDQFNVGFVMVEGDLFGPVSSDKIDFNKQKIENLKTLSSLNDQLKGEFKKQDLDPELQNDLFEELGQEIAKTNREIILNGAPIKLKAEGHGDKDIVLYGSENKDTLDKSALLVRDYIFLQDRMNQIQSNVFHNSLGNSSSLDVEQMANQKEGKWQELLKLLSQNSLNTPFKILETLAIQKGYQGLANLLNKTEEAFNKLIENKNQTAPANYNPPKSPTGSKNPYANMDKNSVQQLITEDEKKINSLVVDKRNVETAENFAKGLKAENKEVGILQFGAGHKEGLVKELNKQGLSVVIVTPNEVARRNSEQK